MRKLWMGLVLLTVAATAATAAPGSRGKATPQAGPDGAPPPATRRGHDDEDEGPVDPSHESNTDYLWRKSDQAFHEGDYDRAVGLHRAIQALDPSDVQSYSVASWLLWSMGKNDDALAMVMNGLKANPDNWDMWDEAAQQYGLMKRDADALDAYGHAVRLIPKDQDSQMLRRRYAHAQEKSGDLKGAVTTWQGLVKDYPNEAVNKNNLARVQAQVNKPAATGTAWNEPAGVASALAGLTAALCLAALLHPVAPPRV
jgi:tetratricopeptide (TPR) repeat protein